MNIGQEVMTVRIFDRRLDREDCEEHSKDLGLYMQAVDELLEAIERRDELRPIDKGVFGCQEVLVATAFVGDPDNQGLDPFALQHHLAGRALLEQALAQFKLADLHQVRAIAGTR